MDKPKECVNSKCNNIVFVPSFLLHLPLKCGKCNERPIFRHQMKFSAEKKLNQINR